MVVIEKYSCMEKNHQLLWIQLVILNKKNILELEISLRQLSLAFFFSCSKHTSLKYN